MADGEADPSLVFLNQPILVSGSPSQSNLGQDRSPQLRTTAHEGGSWEPGASGLLGAGIGQVGLMRGSEGNSTASTTSPCSWCGTGVPMQLWTENPPAEGWPMPVLSSAQRHKGKEIAQQSSA